MRFTNTLAKQQIHLFSGNKYTQNLATNIFHTGRTKNLFKHWQQIYLNTGNQIYFHTGNKYNYTLVTNISVQSGTPELFEH